MSLINDALKRASGTKPRPPGSDGAPLQPVQDGPRGPGALPLVLCIVGIGALLISGAFWLKSRGTVTQVATEKSTGSAIVPPEVAAPAPKPLAVAEPPRLETNTFLPVVPATPAVDSAAAKQPVTQPPPENVAAPVVHTSPAPVTPVQPKPVELNLQAIYYRMRGPTVLINGKTLKVGETVAGAKLLSIERTYVEVEVEGTRRKLTLK